MFAMDWLGGLRVIAVTSSLIFTSFCSLAEPNRLDYDLDDDGLIEINDLEDLNEIRNNLNGTSLYGSDLGCPAEGCIGFELTQNLDFDTNQDGLMNSEDSYWNEKESGKGTGWIPLGSRDDNFSSVFDGNGFEIRNLYIYYSPIEPSLFGHVSNASINNVGVAGPLVSVRGGTSASGLISSLENSTVSRVYFKGSVISLVFSAGLILNMGSNNTVSGCYSAGEVKGRLRVGALISKINGFNNHISSCFSVSRSYENLHLIYDIPVNNTVEASYFSGGGFTGTLSLINSRDKSVVLNSYILNSISSDKISLKWKSVDGVREYYDSYFGIPLAALQCATSANLSISDSFCFKFSNLEEVLPHDLTLYEHWDLQSYIDSNGITQLYWDFGSEFQLPGLYMNGRVHRDSDGDGVMDIDDGFPLYRSASIDSDNDGYPDDWHSECDETCITNSTLKIDQFPNDPSVYLDLDLDGIPDQWNDGCLNQCQLDSGINIDAFLNDQDNDGISDEVDNDDDNDGQPDVDIDSDGLIEIHTLDELNSIRYSLSGNGYKAEEDSVLDVSGCPTELILGVLHRRCHGYELVSDLEFDQNQDQKIDVSDPYWNDGLGWEPIGGYETPFEAKLLGNGFSIRNLFINRPDEISIGLFSYAHKAEFTNLTIEGVNTKITGREFVGALAGRVGDNSKLLDISVTAQIEGLIRLGGVVGTLGSDNKISSIDSHGSRVGGQSVGGIFGVVGSRNIIEGSHFIGDISYPSLVDEDQTISSFGGLIGHLGNNNFINGSFALIDITGKKNIGGLIGGIGINNTIRSTFATGSIVANGTGVGGIVGGRTTSSDEINRIESSYAAIKPQNNYISYSGLAANNSFEISNSYWVIDITMYMHRYVDNRQLRGIKLKNLQCPTSESYSIKACDQNILEQDEQLLFYEWITVDSMDSEEERSFYWDFGESNQLPGLNINGTSYRDSDGDAVLDHLDNFPFDSDNDGIQDKDDFYVGIPLGQRSDIDGDGIPDLCDSLCLDSGMQKDYDNDNDGVDNNDDFYPLTPLGNRSDIDKDGIPDVCGEVCTGLGMEADSDNDNDRVDNYYDVYPLIPLGYRLDSDYDGIPNYCDEECIELGMTQDLDNDNDGYLDSNDAFPFHWEAAVDDDQDGFPDIWLPSCSENNCPHSRLLLDPSLSDSDNDGISNLDDDFPLNIAASKDLDKDGLPDAWNEDCHEECQENSGLQLDGKIGGSGSLFWLLILFQLMMLRNRNYQ